MIGLADKRVLKGRMILVFLVGLLLATRLPVLLSSFPVYRNSEELAYAAIGKSLLDGFGPAIFDYRLTPYANGNIVVGLLAVPFFVLFGTSLFSLKLVSLSFNLGILILLYLFLKKYFGRRVALFSCLLYIMSPPAFSLRSLMVYGNHFESVFFTLLIVFVFYEIFFSGKKNTKYFVLFGLISGLAVYFSYVACLTLFICALLWLAFDRKFFLKKSFAFFALFFLIGLSPLLIFNFKHSFQGLFLHGEKMHLILLKNNLWGTAVNLKNIIFYDMFKFFGLGNATFAAGRIMSWLTYPIFLSSFCVIFWLNRGSILKVIFSPLLISNKKSAKINISKETFFLLYVVIFILIYSVSDLRNWVIFDHKPYQAYRYLVALFPFLAVITAIFFDKVSRGRDKIRLGGSGFAFAGLLAIGLIGNIGLVALSNFGKVFGQSGFSYNELGLLIGENNFGNDKKSAELINKFYSKFKTPACYEGFGWKAGIQHVTDGRYYDSLSRIEERYLPYCYYGVGRAIGEKSKDNPERAEELKRVLENNEKKYRPYIIEGIGLGLWLFDEKEINLSKLNLWLKNMPKEYQKYFCRGLLRGSFSSGSGYNIDKPINLIEHLPMEYRGYAYEGLGWAISETFGDDLTESQRLMKKIDKRFMFYCLQGFIKNRKYFKEISNKKL